MATAKKSAAKKTAAVKTTEPTINLDLLKQINDATMSDAGMMYVSEADYSPLLNAGFAEINAAFVDSEGRIATRITTKGIEEMSKNNQTQTAAAPQGAAAPTVAAANGFAIVSGVVPPVAKRGATGDKKYPFDALQVGQSFFVPASEAMPDPVKKLGSTVSSANARYSVEVPGETRKARNGEVVPKHKATRRFVLRSVEDGAPWGHTGKKGAAIFRIEDNA